MSEPDPLYTIRDVPGKGRGLVATSKILKGTRILSDPPLFRVTRDGNMDGLREPIVRKIASLPDDQRQAYLALHNSFEEDGPELGIARTNALLLRPKTTKGAVFLEASRINHHCHPNAQSSWNENIKKITIHACCDIEQGEEITISYLSEHAGHEARQRALQDDFGFRCSCSLCSLPAAERELSDARLEEIRKLNRLTGDTRVLSSKPLIALRHVQRVLELLKTEGFGDASTHGPYLDALRVAVSNGDVARTKVFADRSLSGRIIVEGRDSPDVEKIQRVSDELPRYKIHNGTSKWRSLTRDIPTGLSEDDFELWLWRQEKHRELQFADLRFEFTFPVFENLAATFEFGPEFEGVAKYTHYRSKHWALLGEIVRIDALFRLRLIVKDKNGEELTIAFHTKEIGFELNSSLVKVGNAVVILNPESYPFLDGMPGIRHEKPELFKMFPVSLNDLLLLSDKMQTYLCHCRGWNENLPMLRQEGSFAKDVRWVRLLLTCQAAGWKDKGHKKDCKLLRDADMRALFRLKWNEFDGHLGFGLGMGE